MTGTARATGPRSTPNRKPVNLALQGGGAHGAFAWGVLDKLLEDGRLDIEAVSATSAGAMNAVVMALRISLGGPAGGRETLNEFWTEISHAGEVYSPVRTLPWERWLQACGFQAELSPTYHAFRMMTHLFSPYQLNPFNFNPLKDVLEQVVDFDKLAQCTRTTRSSSAPPTCAPARSGCSHNEELTRRRRAGLGLPAVTCSRRSRSTARPIGTAAIMGNPAIFPLIYDAASSDVVIVHINPIERPERADDARPRFSTASTRSASTPRSCARCARSNSSPG